MDKAITAELRGRVFVYPDDLLVSPDFNTRLALLEQLAVVLTKAGPTINISKSKFCFRELKYLGYLVGEGKLRPNPEKVKAILKFDYPKYVKPVRGFMRVTGGMVDSSVTTPR